MPEMPIPQDDLPEGIEDTEGLIVDAISPDSDVEELEDGSAVITLEKETINEDTDFYDNIAETMDVWEMDKIALQYLEFIKKDRDAREERDKQYEEGLRRTGLGHDAPGGASFMGASKVVHPVMAEACVDFASRAIKELFPPDGPVRTKIVGEVTPEKETIAERKKDWNNWQLTEQIKEYRDEKEQLLTQLPLGGSQYLKMWFCERELRPRAEFVAIDNILLPFSCVNFYSAQRITEQQDITSMEYESRIDVGLYRDVEFIRPSAEPDQTKSQKANDKIEGRSSQDDNIDGLRRVYHIYTYMELEDDSYSEGKLAPYILMIDEMDSEVLGIYRNWEEDDARRNKLDWIVEFKFIPWRGAYAIGLPHLIGGISAALTGALRALLDTAHINNAATMLKLKGAKISGQSQEVEVTQVTEIEGAPGVDDIRKIAMPMPFNPPSPVLMELLGWLTTTAKGVVSTAEEKIADVNANAPVGTTQALIEQGAVVYSAIHSRLHASQHRVLQILNRINRWYLDDMMQDPEIPEGLYVERSDFDRNSDVMPVSDPNIFSETQRMAQNQALLTLSQQNPDLYDRRAVQKRILKQMKIQNAEELLPDPKSSKQNNPAEENVMMALGQFATAYPNQNHLAHLQTHLSFFEDPAFGSNPIIAPAFLPKLIEHAKQHMTLWYMGQMNGYVQEASGGLNTDENLHPEVAPEVDKAFAIASQHVQLDSQQAFSKVVQVIAKAMQMVQQMNQQPAPINDPTAQAYLQSSMAETQRKTAKDQMDAQLKKEDQQLDIALNAADNLTQERMKTAELTKDSVALQNEQQKTALLAEQSAQQVLGERNV
jgi:hypothetical protein